MHWKGSFINATKINPKKDQLRVHQKIWEYELAVVLFQQENLFAFV